MQERGTPAAAQREDGKLRNFVVGVDGSDGSHRALEWVVALAVSETVSAVHGFALSKDLRAEDAASIRALRAERARQLSDEWLGDIDASTVTTRTQIVDGEPASALVEVASPLSAAVIAIGHGGYDGRDQRHVGDIASRLFHRSPVPVVLTTAETEPDGLEGAVVVAIRRSDKVHPQLGWLRKLWTGRQLDLHVVCYDDQQRALDLSTDRLARRAEDEALLFTTMESLDSSGLDGRVSGEVCDGHAAQALAKVARDKETSLVVVGSHLPGRVEGLLGTSVARSLPPLIRCPMAAIPYRNGNR